MKVSLCQHQLFALHTLELASPHLHLATDCKSNTPVLAHSVIAVLPCSGDHTVKIVCSCSGKVICTLEGHQRTPWVVSRGQRVCNLVPRNSSLASHLLFLSRRIPRVEILTLWNDETFPNTPDMVSWGICCVSCSAIATQQTFFQGIFCRYGTIVMLHSKLFIHKSQPRKPGPVCRVSNLVKELGGGCQHSSPDTFCGKAFAPCTYFLAGLLANVYI